MEQQGGAVYRAGLELYGELGWSCIGSWVGAEEGAGLELYGGRVVAVY